MKKHLSISEDEKWQSVVDCDKSYDGLFNVIFSHHAAEALEKGFRPCKKCCPDKDTFQPELELMKKIKEILDTNYAKSISIYNISKQVGVSPNHMVRLYKKYYGFTP
ncbi:Ada metal-binding domain-containing protein [Desulforamulus aquiferis]|uniref:Ada metal-binding domain-containing protein n=1 Tax=Desulforamulus aquiferis TaxID=1397668 RepID=A0AAW7ZA55_9FIRM|nr:Ada metal-binding domain-containing protein [Desulforamulus aquiferis]MDO7786295.1 Ada metal-binding domain-containing protein [Desulforamulus aquiferis]